VLAAVDKANGCSFATLAGRTPYPPEFLYGSGLGPAAGEVAGGGGDRPADPQCGGAHGLGDVVERLPPLAEGGEGGEQGQEGEEGGCRRGLPGGEEQQTGQQRWQHETQQRRREEGG
jgi:hypothetical protein